MPEITASSQRRIIGNFKREILRVKQLEDPPLQELIDYKNDLVTQNKRDVHLVLLEYLRYRADNARISDEINTFRQLERDLDEQDEDDQKLIGNWLKESDTEKFEVLRKDLKVNPQREVAIITCDGFLINGNRRRKVIETLYSETSDPKYQTMRVVILPSDDTDDDLGDGGAPTIEDIQRIEYAYQVQQSGHSDYTGINRALQYRGNMELGFSLEDQLRRDPQYHDLTLRKFQAAIKKIHKDFLNPLQECDAYLDYFDRPGLYTNVSKTGGSSGGRWQAFIDWSNTYNTHLKEERSLIGLGLDRNQAAKIKEIAYKVIRQRELKTAGKVHSFMRKLPKILKKPEIRRELMKITDERVLRRLPENERVDPEGNPYDPKTLDNLWSGNYGEHIINTAKKCIRLLEYETGTEKPKTLLEAALAKLEHDDMDPESVSTLENNDCIELCEKIQERSAELFTEFDHNRMRLNQLGNRNQ